MPDYKEMYLKMVRASEESMRILIATQQECEDLYIATENIKLSEPLESEILEPQK